MKTISHTGLCGLTPLLTAFLLLRSPLTGLAQPVFTSQPQSQTVLPGADVTFVVEASGAGSLTYQWRFNHADLSGASVSSLTLTNVQLSQQGYYSVAVTENSGTVISRNVLLRVVPGAMPNHIVGWGLNDIGQTVPPPGLTNALMVSAGATHGLALQSDGTVAGWGGTNYGQSSPPAGLTNVVYINAGYYHSLAVTADGTITGWGLDDNGQATPPAGLSNVVAVAGGYVHSLALQSDGTVVGWGAGAFGQQTPPAGLSNVLAIAAAIEHSLALRQDGVVVGWGAPDGRATPPQGLSNVVAIAAGDSHSLALKADGTVVGWGNNNWGQTTPPSGLSNVVAISAGLSHSLALKNDGMVVVWGNHDPPPANLRAAFAIDAGSLFSLALEVFGPLSFTNQPQNQTVNAGTTASFSAAVKGGVPDLVQWQFNGTNIAGATNLTLTLTNVQAANAGNYSVIASNYFGAVASASATLTVTPIAPIITRQPQSYNVPVGFNLTLRVSATGSEPISYQWKLDGVELPGATDAALALPNVQLTNAGTYSVLITNAVGSTNSADALLTVNPPGDGLKSISAPGAVDMVHDAARDIIYITSGSSILRYHVGSNVFLSPFVVGTGLNLWGVDLSFDGNTLVATDHSGGSTSIYVVDLPSETSRQVVLPGSPFGDAGTYSVAFGNDNAALITGDYPGSGPVSLRRYDPVADTNSAIQLLEMRSLVSPSGDGKAIAIIEGAVSSGDLRKYAVAAQQVTNSISTGWFCWIAPGVNKNASQFAYATDGGTFIYGSNFNYLATIGNYFSDRPVGVVYHPTADLVFFVWGGSSYVRAYDTTTLTEITRYDFGTYFSSATGTTVKNSVRIRISRDGSLLMVNVGNAINFLRWPTAQPAITGQPASTRAFMGSNTTFSVQTIGTPPLSYQWRFNGAELDGATNSTLTLTNLQPTQDGNYSVLVYTPYGSVTSAVATLTLDGPPAITAQPQPQTVVAGDGASLSVTCVGTTPFTYQWLLFGTNLASPNAATLTIADAQAANAGDYSVIIANTYGSITSSVATLTVSPTVPIFTLQPLTQSVPAGENLTLTAAAKGTEPLAYQWRFRDADLAGQTSTSLTLTDLQATNTGDYTVAVSNSVDVTLSDVAAITVVPAAPTFTSIPASRLVPRGAEVLFSAAAKGTEPLAFQWRFNGADLPGQTRTSLTLVNVQSNNVGSYTASVTNSQGAATSSIAALNLSAPPGFLWARNGGSSGADLGYCAAVDSAGNAYVAGSFQSSASFGASNLVSAGSSDIFVAKYDPLGQLLWLQRAGGVANDVATSIAVDADGNLFVTGYIGGTATFATITLTNRGGTDIFLAKYDTTGACLWATNPGGTANDQGYGIATAAAGHVFVCGTFSGTATFGTTNLVSSGGSDAFLACYSTSGDLLWARKASGDFTDIARAVACDRFGNVFLAGDFLSDTISFGSVTLTNRSSPVAAFTDGFLAKYDAAGNLQWAAQVTGPSGENVQGLATDPGGNVFLAGYYANAAVFGTLSALTNAGNTDLFLAKYSPAGNALWVRGAGGANSDYGYAVAVDAGGNAFVTGRIYATVRFGTNLSLGFGGDDTFVAMYTTAGDFRWVRRAGSSSTDYGQGIAADNAGNVFLTGYYSANATFDHISLSPLGSSDFFLAKLAALDSTAAPVFTMQPSNQTAQAGANATFNVGFIGAAPVAYQWLFNGTNIADATNATLTLSNATAAQAGGYSVTLSNVNGAVTSAVAALSVTIEPDFLWALRAGGAANDEALAVVADTNGNTYVAGYFSGTADFGGTNLTSSGGEDIFLAKYDSAQNLLWARRAGGSSNDRANGLALDNAGNGVIMVGQFSGTADFDGPILTSAGGTDAFLARYDANGHRLWVLPAGGSGNDAALGVTVAGNGQLFVTGYFQNSAFFGGTLLNSSGTNDIFLAKYNSAGSFFWARAAGGSGPDQGSAVTCDRTGNAYIAGSFSGTANFSGTNLTSSWGLDAFLAKYDSNGNRLWARKAGTSGTTYNGSIYNDEANAIVADRDGNLFLSGYFHNQASFGTYLLTAASTNQPDLFLAKYDSNGNVLWAKTAGGPLADFAKALATDFGGNAYVAGSFAGTAQFNPFASTSVGGADMFVAMYDATGRLLKVRRGGGTGDDAGQAVAVDGRGNAIVAGAHSTPAAFGGLALANAGGKDAFVTKVSFFNPDTPPVITSQPQGVSTGLGSNVVLSVGVSSGTLLLCQWLFNGNVLTGVTNTILTLTSVQYSSFGTYSAVLSNSSGAVTSQTALVTTELTSEVLWTRRLGSTGDDQGLATAVDSANNVYVAGTFSGTVPFGTSNLVSSGGADIFLAKFNAAGGLLWAVKAGGTGADSAPGLALDAAGNIFLAGYFSGSATFGPSNVLSSGSLDFFLAKYDSAGNLLWVKRAGSPLGDQGTSVTTDAAGNAYVTGSYYSGAAFGGIPLTNLNYTNFFLAKYDPAGSVIWAKTTTGVGTCQGSGVSVDAATNVYVTGYLFGSANFGSGSFSNTNPGFNATVFVAKYDRDGVLQWAKKGGTNGLGYGQAIVADPYGNIYATSYKRDYGTGILLTKYDSGGNVLWYRPAAISCCTGDYIAANGLALDATGNPVIVGGPTWSATVEGLGLNRQGFVLKYRAGDGAPFWIQKLGTMGYGAALDAAGNAWLTGLFTYTSTFGTSSNLVSAGGNDVFLVKLGVRPPGLRLAPTNLLVVAGLNATLQATGAFGTGPLAYQWQLNGTNIAGATQSSLTLNNFHFSNAGRYSVVVQNTSGSVTGQVAGLGFIPVLSAFAANDCIVLTWDGTFTLQSATAAAGPYTDWPLAASPFTNCFVPGEPQRFFRLRVGNPFLTSAMQTNQWFNVSVAGSPGRAYTVQASTNLLDWIPLQDDVSPFTLQDSNAPAFPQRFYRAVLAP